MDFDPASAVPVAPSAQSQDFDQTTAVPVTQDFAQRLNSALGGPFGDPVGEALASIPKRQVGVLESGARGVGHGTADLGRAVEVGLGGLASVADRGVSAVTGKPSTALQDRFFQTADTMRDAGDRLRIDPNTESQGTAGKVAEVIGSLAPGLVLGGAGESAEVAGLVRAAKVAHEAGDVARAAELLQAAKTAKAAASATVAARTGTAAKLAAPLATSAGINTATDLVDRGADIDTAVKAGVVSGLSTEAMSMVPFHLAGKLPVGKLTGAAAKGVRIGAGAAAGAGLQAEVLSPVARAAYNATVPDEFEQGDSDTLTEAITGGVFGALGGLHSQSVREHAGTKAKAKVDADAELMRSGARAPAPAEVPTAGIEVNEAPAHDVELETPAAKAEAAAPEEAPSTAGIDVATAQSDEPLTRAAAQQRAQNMVRRGFQPEIVPHPDAPGRFMVKTAVQADEVAPPQQDAGAASGQASAAHVEAIKTTIRQTQQLLRAAKTPEAKAKLKAVLVEQKTRLASVEPPVNELETLAAKAEKMGNKPLADTLRAPAEAQKPVEPVAAPAEAAVETPAEAPDLPKVHPRVAAHADTLSAFADYAGWQQRGGELIRSGEGGNAVDEANGYAGQSGEVVGRTAWIPKAPWFADLQREAPLTGNFDGDATRAAVKKAIAGKKLGNAQQRHVDTLLSIIEAEKEEAQAAGVPDYDPFAAAETAAEVGGVHPVDVALVERATAIDEAAVEAAATKFENDDAKFMEVVRGILRSHEVTHEQGQEAGQGGEDVSSDQGAEDAAQEPAADAAGEHAPVGRQPPEAAQPAEEFLTAHTEADVARRERARVDADTQQREADQAAQDRADADRQRGDFKLTGSDRDADVAASKGQADLLASSREPAAKISDLGEKIGAARKDTADRGYTTGRAKPATEDERPTWAKRYAIQQAADDGRWTIRDKRDEDFMGRPRQVGTTFATQEEAEAFLPMAAVAAKHRVRAGENGTYEIWRNVSDRKSVKVVDQSFDSRESAMEYMAHHAAEILETNTTFGESDLPQPPDRKRVGAERRKGNVKGDDFMSAFGLRGVEFGNWNNQSERQALMNDAYDGLSDLADVLGIPAKAIGLNGDLALAFGARGHGLNSARAHYERDRVVINLTKENGAGSLAHEWFHALDAYLGRQDGKAPSQWDVGADGTRTLKTRGVEDYATHGFRTKDSVVREEVRKAYEALVNAIFKKGITYVDDASKADEFVGRARNDLQEQLDMLRKELAEQKDATYWKRNNKPASPELLAEFDTIAKRMLEGEAQSLATDWRKIDGMKARVAARWTNDSLERLNTIFKQVRNRSGFDSQHANGWMDKLRGYMNRYSARLKMLAEAQAGAEKTRMVPTDFAMNAKELDQGRGGEYWTTPHEMAARAFQGYVEDKVAAGGGVSRFLNYAPENGGVITPWGVKFPFPRKDERQAINAALDAFVKILKTKETDQGVALYSRGTGAGMSVDAVRAHLSDTLGPSRVKMLEQAGHLKLVESAADLPTDGSESAAADVRGLYDGKTAYLVAANLDKSNAVGVLLHELGAHASLKKMLGEAKYAGLMSHFDNLVAAGDAHAVRVENHVLDLVREGKLAEEHENDERIAYAVEYAANAKPETLTGKFKVWIQRALAGIKSWAYTLPGLDGMPLNTYDMAALARRAVEKMAGPVKADGAREAYASEPLFSRGESAPLNDEESGRPTSIKNATVADERATRGMPQAAAAARRAFGKVWDEAAPKNEHDWRRISDLVEELRRKPRAVTDTEDAMLLHKQISLQGEYDQLSKKMADAYEGGRPEVIAENRGYAARLSDDLLALYNVNKRVGTETARGLNARRILANEDYSLAKMEVKAREAVGGRRLSEAEKGKIKEAHGKIVETQKALDENVSASGGKRARQQQTIEALKKRLTERINELETQIRDQKKTPAKERTQRELDDEVEHLVAVRDNLKEQFDKMFVRKMPDEQRLLMAKARFRKTLQDIQERAASGDFENVARAPVALDAEGLHLKAVNEDAKLRFERMRAEWRLNGRTTPEKVQDTWLKWRRAFLLSSPVTIAKLSSAALERMAFTPVEEVVGAALGKLPGVSKVADMAPREGGVNIRAEAKALTQAWTKGMADAFQTLTTGHGELDSLFGKRDVMPREAIDFIGAMHGFLKAPTKRAEFERSLEKRAAFAMKNGSDVSDPAVQAQLMTAAYKDANRAIFMQNNVVVDAYKRALSALKQADPKTGKTPGGRKAAATALQTIFPIVKVPTNVVAETLQYALGSVTGSTRLGLALARGVKTLSQDDADLIMRELKKGSIGGAMMVAGYLLPNLFGGYYQSNDRHMAGHPKWGTMQLGDWNVPTFLLHNPLLETLQIGATIRHVSDSKLRVHDLKPQGIGAGITAALLGVIEEVPFVNEMTRMESLLNPMERGKFLYQFVRDLSIPLGVQWAAKQLDTDSSGNTKLRNPEGFWETLESGLPGLREDVPAKLVTY